MHAEDQGIEDDYFIYTEDRFDLSDEDPSLDECRGCGAEAVDTCPICGEPMCHGCLDPDTGVCDDCRRGDD